MLVGAVLGVVLGARSEPVASPSAAPVSAAPGAVQISRADLERITTTRQAALQRRDLKGFLAPLDQGNRALIDGQTRLFHNLQKVTFTEQRFGFVDQAGRSIDRFGRGVTVHLDVAFVHQIKDFDNRPVAEWYRWTITKKDAAAPAVITDVSGAPGGSLADSKTYYYPAPWDKYDDMRVTRTPHVLLLTDRAMEAKARRYANVAEKAATDVLGAWRRGGQDGPVLQRFVASLVPNKKELGSLYQIATDKVTEAGHSMPMVAYDGKGGEVSGGARVVMDTSSGFFADDAGAGEILRHEFTHAMLEGINRHDNDDAAIWGQEPWITEGIAEYVANRDHGGPANRDGGARSALRAGEFPARMPNALAFGGDARVTNLHYYIAHQAIRHIVARYGELKMFAFVAAYYGGASVADAARTTLGADADALRRAALAYAKSELT
ncbi:hypothetical protein [Spirilliplanes yamanashiensis]|uniref:hypothetical protein n=1 Tax=Spirilliplanes yamanashiensis TaxID=42233 RepID=UPI00194E264C|nr:hypothetical protein [Spirilliplanes yamanashiensis]MDP9815603.1 hypothetical protein [Spirilliplanes yamanashiensis]